MVAQSSAPDHIARGKSAQSTDLIIERRHRMVQPFAGGRRGTLLDFGCGTGAQTLLFADEFDHITGVDVDASSLQKFRDAIARRGLSGRVEAVEYDGTTLPLRDA